LEQRLKTARRIDKCPESLAAATGEKNVKHSQSHPVKPVPTGWFGGSQPATSQKQAAGCVDSGD
jgi:hypothetical protein